MDINALWIQISTFCSVSFYPLWPNMICATEQNVCHIYIYMYTYVDITDQGLWYSVLCEILVYKLYIHCFNLIITLKEMDIMSSFNRQKFSNCPADSLPCLCIVVIIPHSSSYRLIFPNATEPL